MKDNDCNPFSPTEKCKPILDCIKGIDEPAWTEIKNAATVGFSKLEKMSATPFVIIGLIGFYQIKNRF